MPSDIKVKVELKRNHIRWGIWYCVAWLFGMNSFVSQFTWWFLEPLMIHTAKTGWIPVEYRFIPAGARWTASK